VVDSARREDVPDERWDPRVLSDGSRHRVYKRWFTPPQLASELAGEVVHAGHWFVAVLAARGVRPCTGVGHPAGRTVVGRR
jgi:hypothetical protein